MQNQNELIEFENGIEAIGFEPWRDNIGAVLLATDRKR